MEMHRSHGYGTAGGYLYASAASPSSKPRIGDGTALLLSAHSALALSRAVYTARVWRGGVERGKERGKSNQGYSYVGLNTFREPGIRPGIAPQFHSIFLV